MCWCNDDDDDDCSGDRPLQLLCLLKAIRKNFLMQVMPSFTRLLYVCTEMDGSRKAFFCFKHG